MANQKRIKDLPTSKRPREKMVEKGKDTLSDEELVALLLGTGSGRHNAIELARALLKQCPVPLLHAANIKDITVLPGIGVSKATRVLAAMELGSRAFSQPKLSIKTIKTVRDVLDQVKDVTQKHQEHLVVLYLNARHELIINHTVSLGRLNVVSVEPRDILSHALSIPCTSMIMVHNHPSGDPTPSEDDVKFTVRMQEASDLLGIHIADHVIVSASDYFSFRDNKLIFV